MKNRALLFAFAAAAFAVAACAAPARETGYTNVVEIVKSDEWTTITDTTDVKKGSALDFSSMGWLDAPAGKYGRVVAKGQHFEFEKRPGVKQRFYGVNLCFSANYLDEKVADELCRRLAGLGYNAVRIHHHERHLVDPEDGTTIIPEQMAKLDNLLNACIKHGLYITTDLYVSRPVPWRVLGRDTPGTVNPRIIKDMILFDAKTRANYLEFVRAFLCHVNPKTGRRWADEPALVCVGLINEGNPGNWGYAQLPKIQGFRDLWKKDMPRSPQENSPLNRELMAFLSDHAARFADEMRIFLRDEIKTGVLFSDMASWNNPPVYQLARTHYDYVDSHFYVDHPKFLKRDWSLPSTCPNVNPVRRADMGFEETAVYRLLDKPLTITEFNYSGPGQYRGIGGLLVGAQAALQDYAGVWRFAWSHYDSTVLKGTASGYFDIVSDPLQRATERAVVMLYMRGDLKPLEKTFAIVLPEDKLRAGKGVHPNARFRDLWLGWYRKIGTWIGDGKPDFADAACFYPEVYWPRPNRFRNVGDDKPGDGQISVDRKTGVFGINTPKTQGVFSEGGKSTFGAITADISLAPGAVWVSSLDNEDIVRSKRLLLTHVADVQNLGAVYGDEKKTVLLKRGRLPYMMRAARAEIALKLEGAAKPCVYALAADGTRRGIVESAWKDGTLSFTADTARDKNDATYLYEIVRAR